MLIKALKDVHQSIKSKKYIDQLFKIIRLLVIGSQLEEAPVSQKQEEKPSQEDDYQYTTPKKQIKHHTDVVSAFDGKITQELLFGETAEEEKPKVNIVLKKDQSQIEQKDDHLEKILQ